MAESEIASPLYSEGVHHAEVTSPMSGTPTPDPMGYLSSSPPSAQIVSRGSGDDVNDWKDTSFPEDDGQGA